MSSDVSREDEEIEVILVPEEIESSEDPPPEEWPSLIYAEPEINEKRQLYEQGLYSPGSGEICAKYVAVSDSFIYRHPYYPYPCVLDPGIIDALLQPHKQTLYTDDGQELYLALCEDMGIGPVRMFYRNLMDKEINLRYYGIRPEGFRPMALALKLNRYVRVLDLTDNFISEDGCFHLGEMLIDNFTLAELNLSGCRIGPSGAEKLMANLHVNRGLRKLNLSRNKLLDEGVGYLAKAVSMGADITNVNLSYNDLTTNAVTALAESFEVNNKFTHLDLSWNSLVVPRAMELLCSNLANNKHLLELNFSWNALTSRFGTAIAAVLTNPQLRYLNLSNNKLCDNAIGLIANNISKAKQLDTLDLSDNPLSLQDAKKILNVMKFRRVKLNNLLLNNVNVDLPFIYQRECILALKHKAKSTITYGEVQPHFVAKGVDVRTLVLMRAQKVCSKPKKKAVDVPLMILELHKANPEPIWLKDFPRHVKMMGAFQMNDDLIEEIGLAFPGPRKGKFKTVNFANMAEYVHRLWPDAKLPATPPPEQPPPPPKSTKPAKGKQK